MSIRNFYEEHKALTIGIALVLLAVVYAAKENTLRFPHQLSSISDGAFTVSNQDHGESGINVAKGVGGGAMGFTEEMALDASRSFMPPSPQFFGSGNEIVIEEEKIIKTAQLSLEVDSVDSAIESIENIAKNNGGFVNNSSASERNDGSRFGAISIKVPVDTFDAARNQIKEASVFVQNENINTRDVTEEFIDVEARLRNLEAQETSYLTLLNRASKIEDIITITQNLTNVRTQIEQTEGRKRYLEGQTDFSTINISLTEDREVTLPSKKWRPLTVIQDAARNTVLQFQGFIDNIIEFTFWAVGIIPYLILIGIIVWAVKRFRN